MWYYKKSEPQLWTVGYDSASGDWTTDSDHDSRESAAQRVAFLNGGGQRSEIAELSQQLTNARSEIKALRGIIGGELLKLDSEIEDMIYEWREREQALC